MSEGGKDAWRKGGGRLAVALVLLAALTPCSLPAVQCPSGTPPPCARTTTSAVSPGSVAVLYFDNRSADSADQYLADGVTEEIINRLAMLERLEVKSRTAVVRLRGSSAPPDSLGRALRVAYLVSGTVQRSSGRLRVSVELVRASTGVTTWAARFDRSDSDLLDIQAAMADSVAQAVAGRLLPRERGALARRATTNAEAWDHFQRGNFRLARRTAADVALAINEFEAAVRLDPSFATAHARIALAYGVALDWGWPSFEVQRSIRSGLAASARALELDSMLPDSWTARGYLLRFGNARTHAGVREAFQRALALAPRDAEAALQFGWALACLGDTEASVSMLRRAVALDPERVIARFTLALALMGAHRAPEALVQLDSAIAYDPSAANVHGLRAWARLGTGDVVGARADAEREPVDRWMARSALAALEAHAGDSAAAQSVAVRLVAELPPPPARLTWGAGWIAFALAATGQTERAMDIMERIEPQGLTVWWLTQFPGFDGIRREPAFARFAAELAPTASR